LVGAHGKKVNSQIGNQKRKRGEKRRRGKQCKTLVLHHITISILHTQKLLENEKLIN